MTRFLSELLGTPEQMFRQTVNKLERVSQHSNADIRLTAEVVRAAKIKIQQLGLDPHDTTGPELYAALENRLKEDDARLIASLQATAPDGDIVAAIAHALRTVPIPRTCFGLKNSVAKQLLKHAPPKKAMRQLGYRSFDSMLKHEPVAQLYAAAWLVEGAAWRKSMLEQYRNLRASDFETRNITVLNPATARWQKLAQQAVSRQRHNVLAFRELGAIVLLPLPTDQLPASATVTLILALHTMNEVRASSTYLKLCQVTSDFGAVVQTVVNDEPRIQAALLDEPIHWQIVQRYYARFRQAFRVEIFEPHVQPEDLSWHSIELVLQHLDKDISFWRGTGHLAAWQGHAEAPVSFNVIDVALNACNQLPYAERLTHYCRLSLWHELLLKYLKHDSVEQAILGQLQSELVTQPALI